MNIKNLLVSAVIFSATVTNFNIKTINFERAEIVAGALAIAAAGILVGTNLPSAKQTNLKEMLAEKEAILKEQNISLAKNEATIKDLRDRASEIEDFTVIGKDGIVLMRQSFGDTLDSLNKHAQENSLILTDKTGRNHVLCPEENGERYVLFGNTRDFHNCPEWMDAFNKSSKKNPTN
jgi:hypothetical protein